MLTEREKKCFESHEATLLDYGTIKVLDFKKIGAWKLVTLVVRGNAPR